MNTGSANGQDWGVIDFPRNPSACWESTAEEEEEEASLTLSDTHTHQHRLWFFSVINSVDTDSEYSSRERPRLEYSLLSREGLEENTFDIVHLRCLLVCSLA